MKRFLFVTTVPITLKSFLLPIAQHLRAQGHLVDAMAKGVTDCPQCADAFDRVWEVEWSRSPLAPVNLLRAPRQIQDVVARREYDLVHVHTPVAAFVTRYALRNWRRGGKVIYTAHGFHFHDRGAPLSNAMFLGLERAAGPWTDHLVVINRDDEAAAIRHRLVPRSRLHYMPGIGVDRDLYNPSMVSEPQRQAIQQELGLDAASRLFLMIAEFIPRKRHVDAVRAFASLSRSDAHLAFAGTGPEMEAIQRLTRQEGVADRVHFLGFRRDIPALTRASVAVLLPSTQEGLPRSIMEALCLEVPVIGTNIRGTRELLAEGAGFLVEVGDVPGLARAMRWVLDHPEETDAMGRLGREQMAAYAEDRIVELHDALYAEALGIESHEASARYCRL
jgi:glycosyltransferase involved in cell wall biosynthesis